MALLLHQVRGEQAGQGEQAAEHEQQVEAVLLAARIGGEGGDHL